MGNSTSTPGTAGAAAAVLEEHQSKMQEIEAKDCAIRTKYDVGMAYSLKIVLCGARGAGKTSLFNRCAACAATACARLSMLTHTDPCSRRLQGLGFSAVYRATPQIQIANINWQMKSSADNIKAEVWDVVDQGFTPSAEDAAASSAATAIAPPAVIDKKLSEVTKSDAGSTKKGQTQFGYLDSSVVDVYKGANAVLFVVSPTDRASLDYVAERFPSVPIDVPVLLLLGMRDVRPEQAAAAATKSPPGSKSNSSSNLAAESEDATAAEAEKAAEVEPTHPVTIGMVSGLCADIVAFRRKAREQATTTSGRLAALLLADEGLVHCFEISCKNCFGLKELYHSLSIPFLHLKRATVLQQVGIIGEQMDGYSKSLRDQVAANEYAAYEEQYDAKLRERAEAAHRAQLLAEGAAAESSSEEELSLPRVRGDRHQRRQRDAEPSPRPEDSRPLKLTHGGAPARDNMNGFLSDSDDVQPAPPRRLKEERKEEPKKKAAAKGGRSKNKYFADTSSSSENETPSPRSRDGAKRLSGGLTRVAGKARMGASPLPPLVRSEQTSPADGLDDFVPQAAEPCFDDDLDGLAPVAAPVAKPARRAPAADSDSDYGVAAGGRQPDLDDLDDVPKPTLRLGSAAPAPGPVPAAIAGSSSGLSAAAQAAIAAAMSGLSGEAVAVKKEKKDKKTAKKDKKTAKKEKKEKAKKPAEQDFYGSDSGSGVDF